MTWSNLRFNVSRSFVTMATNLPSCFSIEFLEQLLKFLVNFTLLKYVKSQSKHILFLKILLLLCILRLIEQEYLFFVTQ